MAGRPQKTIQQQIDEQIDQLISTLWNLCNNYQYDVLKAEVKNLIYHAEIIKEKLPKITTLGNSIGRKFVKITNDGQVEEISFDEGYRKIMGYLPEGESVIGKLERERELYKQYWYEFVHWLEERNSGNTNQQETTNSGRAGESV